MILLSTHVEKAIALQIFFQKKNAYLMMKIPHFQAIIRIYLKWRPCEYYGSASTLVEISQGREDINKRSLIFSLNAYKMTKSNG